MGWFHIELQIPPMIYMVMIFMFPSTFVVSHIKATLSPHFSENRFSWYTHTKHFTTPFLLSDSCASLCQWWPNEILWGITMKYNALETKPFACRWPLSRHFHHIPLLIRSGKTYSNMKLKMFRHTIIVKSFAWNGIAYLCFISCFIGTSNRKIFFKWFSREKGKTLPQENFPSIFLRFGNAYVFFSAERILGKFSRMWIDEFC